MMMIGSVAKTMMNLSVMRKKTNRDRLTFSVVVTLSLYLFITSKYSINLSASFSVASCRAVSCHVMTDAAVRCYDMTTDISIHTCLPIKYIETG
mmetsp:Transcript_18593/g.18830  ORF Transcript_18593/g.18830 Transcript_18593/m.18830 type:complete len:94 (+) Transcript_18593:1525-1806(+)